MGLLIIVGLIIVLWVITWPFRKYSEHKNKKEEKRKRRKRERERKKKKEKGINVDEMEYPVFIEAKSSLNEHKIREAWSTEWQPREGQSEKQLCRALKRKFEKEKVFHGDIRFFPSGEGSTGRRVVTKEDERRSSYYPDITYYDKEGGIAFDIEVDEPYFLEDGEKKPIHYVWEGPIDGELRSDDRKRDSEFAENGWHVVRFSERQAREHPEECASYVETILRYVTGRASGSRSGGRGERSLPSQKRWTSDAATGMNR